MYRRYYQNDELLSGVILSFTALLIFAFLVSLKLVGVDEFDVEMYVYISLGSISFIISITMFVLFLVGNRKPFIDIEIDFDQELIYVFNRLKVYTFEDVKLISYNKRHRQIRIFLKRRLLGFSLATIQNKNDISITIEQAMTIGKYGYEVAPKRLYNYHLLLSLVFTGLFVFYAFVISYQEFVWFKKWYIHSYYMLGATVLCIGIAVLLNQTRMKKIYQEQLNTTESTSGD